MFTVNSFSRIVCRSFILASLATAVFAAQPIVKTVPWVAADSSVPHDAVAFKAVTLKGTSSLQGANIRATWDFGDGSPTVSSTVTNAYDVSTTHTYSGVAGTTYNARLTVTDSSTGEYSFADYPVAVREATLDVLVNVAIDEGLWYLHRSMNRTATSGDWLGTSCFACDVTGEATAWNLLAFQRQGHSDTGDSANPYTETVARAHAAVLVQMAAQQPKGAVFARAAGIAAQADTQASAVADTAAVMAVDAGTLVARQNAQGYWLGNNPVSAAAFETGQAVAALTATPVRLAGANSVTNVSSQVLVTNTGFTFNRATGTYSGNLTVKNITASTLAGPITLKALPEALRNELARAVIRLDPQAIEELIANAAAHDGRAAEFLSRAARRLAYTEILKALEGAAGSLSTSDDS